MKRTIQIDVDLVQSGFVLSGDIASALKNARLLFALKRLEFRTAGENLIIPFNSSTTISTLREIQSVLERFSFTVEFTEATRNEFASYDREQKLFGEFSENARNIRDNRFLENPALVEQFANFQRIIKESIPRNLYPMQLLSAFHLAYSQHACNFAVPGAGKTSIVFAAYAFLKSLPKNHPRHVDNIMVVGPLACFAPWEKEYQACFGRRVISQRLSGDPKILREHKEQHLYSGNPAELTLIFFDGVDSLRNDILAFLRKHKTMLVVDEAHRIKNPDGVWGKSVVEISKEAISRVVLTGTPVPNGYQDFYNLFQFLYPFRFKDIIKAHFENLKEMTEKCEPDDSRVREFTDNIAPFFIRIKKTDLNLPPAKSQTIEIKMDSAQREIYDFIESKYVKSFAANSSGNIKDFLNRAKLIRLRQAASNPKLLLKPIVDSIEYGDEYSGPVDLSLLPNEFQEDSYIISKIRDYSEKCIPEKFIAIKDLFEKLILPENGKLIVWSIFIQNAKQLQKYLSENHISSRLLIGEVVQADREIIIDAFNDPANSDFQVVIANPFAVSESISLHKGCHNAAYLERDYNCATFLQSKDRIHRYGLPKDQITRYFYLISADSIDEVIDRRLEEKVKRMEKIIDEDIPLFARINDSDETDLIKALLIEYAKRV